MTKDNENTDIIDDTINNGNLEKDNCEESIDETIEESNDEVDNLKNSLARLQADFINYRNRVEKERSLSIALANEGLIIKLLPVLDDLDRAIENMDKESEIAKGISMINDNLINTLKSEGVDVIPTDGGEFDPNFHHAIFAEENSEVKENTILETFQKGYKIRDKVIRPSMVKVSK